MRKIRLSYNNTIASISIWGKLHGEFCIWGSSNIEAVRAPFVGRRKGGGGAEEGRRKGGASLKIQGGASLKIQGGASSLA
jgi:hypothetical protein